MSRQHIAIIASGIFGVAIIAAFLGLSTSSGKEFVRDLRCGNSISVNGTVSIFVDTPELAPSLHQDRPADSFAAELEAMDANFLHVPYSMLLKQVGDKVVYKISLIPERKKYALVEFSESVDKGETRTVERPILLNETTQSVGFLSKFGGPNSYSIKEDTDYFRYHENDWQKLRITFLDKDGVNLFLKKGVTSQSRSYPVEIDGTVNDWNRAEFCSVASAEISALN